MDKDQILEKLNRIEKFIFCLKDILNVEELSEYSGFAKSYIYKLVHYSIIPYSKPNGKTLFFERKKIDEWLLQNSCKSHCDLKFEAQSHVKKKKKSFI